MLTYSTRAHQADWIVHSSTEWYRLLTFGPAGFEQYARVLYIADPGAPGQQEGDAGLLPGGLSEFEIIARAVAALTPFTTTPEQGFFAVWHSGVTPPTPLRHGAGINIPHRSSYLAEGPLAEIDRWYGDLRLDQYDHPSFAWPADHAWCLAADVDPHWAGVGASAEGIAALAADPLLHVVPADPSTPQPVFNGH